MELGFKKLIQWSENQNFDRSVNLCVRNRLPSIKIYGTQFFVKAKECFNYRYSLKDHSEVVPDVLLMNGPIYEDKLKKIFTGPSLRYQWIYQRSVTKPKNTSILVLLPYWHYKIQKILTFLNTTSVYQSVFLKFHPSTNVNNYKKLIKKFNIENRTLDSSLSDYSFVIGTSTGSLLECIACGVPVGVYTKNIETEYNLLPIQYKGKIWDEFSNEVQLSKLIDFFLTNVSEERFKVIKKISNKVKDDYFCKYDMLKLNELLSN